MTDIVKIKLMRTESRVLMRKFKYIRIGGIIFKAS